MFEEVKKNVLHSTTNTKQHIFFENYYTIKLLWHPRIDIFNEWGNCFFCQ